MSNDRPNLETLRFLRMLRIATQSALARYELVSDGRERRSAATFLALAAKGADAWRFPVEGLLSADGLVLATVIRDGATASALVFQAQGAVGLSSYMELEVRLRLNSGREVAGAFDRDGRLFVPLDSSEIDESDLVGFVIETGNESR